MKKIANVGDESDNVNKKLYNGNVRKASIPIVFNEQCIFSTL